MFEWFKGKNQPEFCFLSHLLSRLAVCAANMVFQEKSLNPGTQEVRCFVNETTKKQLFTDSYLVTLAKLPLDKVTTLPI